MVPLIAEHRCIINKELQILVNRLSFTVVHNYSYRSRPSSRGGRTGWRPSQQK